MNSVSIIIPAYNSAAWIKRCLDSVVAAADHTCDIMVVDDGSSDMTLQVVEDFAHEHPHIPIHSTSINHGGPGAARRAGFHATRGQWLYFVDSDDIIPNDSIKRLKALIEDDTDIVCGNVTIKRPTGSSFMLNGSLKVLEGREFGRQILEGKIMGIMPAKLFRRSAFDGFVWDDDPALTNHEDAMVLLTVASMIKGKVKIAPAVQAYTYILRGGSQSSMLHLNLTGVERVWNNVKKLDLPREAMVKWGLSLLYQSFISRGVVFENSYPPAAELRRLSRQIDLDRDYRRTAWMLYSKRLRHYIMKRHVTDGLLTTAAPHMGFIIYCHNNVKGVHLTIKSILDTGFRNIEIIIVNDASDEDTSVKLNALQVRYRRVRVLKNTTCMGPSASRARAIRSSQAFAMMFMRPGDRINRQGVFNALLSIDDGADMVVMGSTTFSTLLRTHRSHIDPVKKFGRSDNVAQPALDDIINRFATAAPLGAIIFRREYFTDDDLIAYNDDPQWFGGELLTRLSLNLRQPDMRAVSDIGYIRSKSPTTYLTMDTRWHRGHKLAIAMFDFLDKSGRSDLFGEAITGLDNAVAHNIACRLINPFRNRQRIKGLIDEKYSEQPTRQLYEKAGQPIPDAGTISKRARQMLKAHPGLYMRMWFLRH